MKEGFICNQRKVTFESFVFFIKKVSAEKCLRGGERPEIKMRVRVLGQQPPAAGGRDRKFHTHFFF